MKTYRNLYPQICSFQNLLSAFWKARRHKSARPYVAAFEFDLERNLFPIGRGMPHQPQQRVSGVRPVLSSEEWLGGNG